MGRLITRCLVAAGLALCALLGGCRSGSLDKRIVLPYGMPPPVEHPTVSLIDFTYTPASPIHIGDTVVFTASTNQPVANGEVKAHIFEGTQSVALNDSGQPPDAVALDGKWAGEFAFSEEITRNGMEVSVSLEFTGEYYRSQGLLGPPLTILPAEEE